MLINSELEQRILEQLKGDRKITFLVGAGLSAESGIPTFRDSDGFWTAGSKNYTPQEIGTKKFYTINSNEVWRWFLYRMSICHKAQPNVGHDLLVKFEKLLQDRFALISQNVDGLHFEAGNSAERLYLIHGDLRYMRCGDECSKQLYPIPSSLFTMERTRQTPLTYDESLLLKCPKCGEDSRPHVLWFDEYYDEKFYKLESTLRIAKESGLLFIIGTSGATTLPQKLVEKTLSRSGVVIDINPNENYFTGQLADLKNGYIIKQTSSVALSALFKLVANNL